MKGWLNISRRQNMEMGVLVAIVMLVMNYSGSRQWLHWTVIIDLLIVLIWPKMFKPIAFLWFGLATLLSAVFSKLVLTLVFIVIIAPVGILRKTFGIDNLKLKGYKKGKCSVFHESDYLYKPADFENAF